MKDINIQALIDSCDKLSRRCTRIAGTTHESSWLLDKMIRWFEANPACVSVMIPVFLNAPIMQEGEAEIGRDGTLTIRTI